MLTDDINIVSILNIVTEGSLYVVSIIFIGFSLSIAYHWHSYGTDKSKLFLMFLVYLGVSAVLFLSMFIIMHNL